VAAARILETPRLVPIHYDAIHHPPVFEQTDEIPARLEAALGRDGDPELVMLAEGETLDL